MGTKNILLTKKDTELLEEIVIKYGVIVTSSQVLNVLAKKYVKESAYNRLNFYAKNGWLTRLKNGLFIIVTDFTLRGKEALSLYSASYALNPDSYISLEYALAYHHVFDQMLSGMRAVTFKRARKYKVLGHNINFLKIKKNLFFGFNRMNENGMDFNMATPEKAFLDILYFYTDDYHVSLLRELAAGEKQAFNAGAISAYALKYGETVQRKAGFIFDMAGYDTKKILAAVKGKKNYAKLTKDSTVFNSKWRVYHDNKTADKN